MSKNKASIRHEILNLITLINFKISEAGLKEEKRIDLLKFLKMLTLLINYEDVLLGNSKVLTIMPIDLNEVLETVMMIHETELKMKDIKLILPSDELRVQADRKLMQEALEQIFLKLMEKTKKIVITYDNGVLNIEHDSSDKITDQKEDLMTCLMEKKANSEFIYQLALHLLELNGAKLTSKKGLIRISF